MAIAYLDTNSGIAGDMTLAALVDAGADADYVSQQIHSLGLESVELKFQETQKHCFRALMLDVVHPPEHAHRHLSTIEGMIDASQLTSRERSLALRVFRKIGAAEAKVHGTSIEDVHFHEVGAVDSIVDIVGTAVALCSLDVQRIIASPTPTGCGTISIAHGNVTVPAPATAELLKGVPIKSSEIQAELTTPTGAAFLSTLVDGFGTLPDMQISKIGYGAGHKELKEQANLLRILIGEPIYDTQDEILVLETNLDDATGEQIGFATEQLWKAGALDVYTTPISMKKNRPATMLSVICRPESRVALEEVLFKHTGSLGIRRSQMARSKMHREIRRVETEHGDIRIKIAWTDGDATQLRFSPEYEDCKRIAEAKGLRIEAVYLLAIDAAEKQLSASSQSTQAAAAHDHSHDHSHDHGHDHHH